MRQSEIQFIRQQGFTNVDPDHRLYVALMFQPRTIAGILALGLASQSGWLFLALATVLWWGAIVPTRNLFDAAYNRLVAYPRGLPSIPIAPSPRRFAQAVAATVPSQSVRPCSRVQQRRHGLSRGCSFSRLSRSS